MDIEEIKRSLREVTINYDSRNSRDIFESLSCVKQSAVKQNNQILAKDVWCVEQILKVQEAYIAAYNLFRKEQYYQGWCSLERSEIEYSFLFRHFKEENDEYWIEFIRKMIEQYQSIFPYKIFFSPEYIKQEVRCSICNQVVTLRNRCKHEVGEIYDGEMCGRVIKKSKFLGISMVSSPVQRYSVPFTTDAKTGEQVDHYNYSLVRFVVSRLQSPFHDWDMQWTKKRHPHSMYNHIGRNDKCPCDSGKKYKNCCLNESGVLRPHCQIEFSVEPPAGLPMFEYS